MVKDEVEDGLTARLCLGAAERRCWRRRPRSPRRARRRRVSSTPPPPAIDTHYYSTDITW